MRQRTGYWWRGRPASPTTALNTSLPPSYPPLLPPSLFPPLLLQVFPQLYLPVMNEANRRVLRPYRMYLPTPEWFRFSSRMGQLNGFLIDLFRRRWQARQAAAAAAQGEGSSSSKPKPADILDRIMEAIEVGGGEGVDWEGVVNASPK